MAVLTNSTVTLNQSTGKGGGVGIFQDGSLTIHNSVLAENVDNGTGPEFTAPTGAGTLEVRSSLISSSTGTTLTPSPNSQDGNGNRVGTPDDPIDPLLGPLDDNGGSTQTHSLLSDSPAIDLGQQ